MTRRNRCLAGVACVFLTCVASATPILAADGSSSYDFPVVLFDLHGGAPTRLSGGATVLLGKTESGTMKTKHAVEIQASAGMGGARVAGGMAFLNGPFGPDVLFSLTRTSASARGATAHATYMGLEAGYTWLFFRPSIGVAHRVAGPSGPKATVFTWQVGVQLPLGHWR